MTVFLKNYNSSFWLKGVRNPLRLSTLDSNLSVKVRHHHWTASTYDRVNRERRPRRRTCGNQAESEKMNISSPKVRHTSTERWAEASKTHSSHIYLELDQTKWGSNWVKVPPRLTATSRQVGPFGPNTPWSPPLTFKNFPLGGQQQGYSSKQATDNFIHVDSAVVPLTPQRAGLTLLSWMQVFFVLFFFILP